MMRSSATFRIIKSELDPAAITGLLGLEPDLAFRRGTPEQAKAGRIYALFYEGVWGLRSPETDGADLEGHIRLLLGRMAGKEAGLKKLKQAGYRMDVFFELQQTQGSFTVSIHPVLLARLAKLGVAVDFDIRADDNAEFKDADNPEGL